MASSTKTSVKISVNGQPVVTAAATLAEFVIEQGHGKGRVATAVNGAFVPAAGRAAHKLAPGDRIEIVSARQGG